MTEFDTRIQQKGDSQTNFETNNPVLLKNEFVIVYMNDGSIRFKVGDGVNNFNDLEYVTQQTFLNLGEQQTGVEFDLTPEQMEMLLGDIPPVVQATVGGYYISLYRFDKTDIASYYSGTLHLNDRIYFVSLIAQNNKGTIISDNTTKIPVPTKEQGNMLLVSNTSGGYNLVQNDISKKANINSPAFTGIPTAPTAGSGTNNTQIATTAFVANALSTVSGGTEIAISSTQPPNQAIGDLWYKLI